MITYEYLLKPGLLHLIKISGKCTCGGSGSSSSKTMLDSASRSGTWKLLPYRSYLCAHNHTAHVHY